MTIPNLCNPDGSCAGNCAQGECIGSVNASRRVFWLRPLPPDPAPEEDHGIYFWLAIVFAAFVAAYFQPFNF